MRNIIFQGSLSESMAASVVKLSEADLDRLKEVGALCRRERPIWNPGFFLSSIDRRNWSSAVSVVSTGGTVKGIMYAKERCILGVPTGIIYADGSLGSMVIAGAPNRESVFYAAIDSLLNSPRVQGLRLVVPPNGFELQAILRLLDSGTFDVSYASVKNHAIVLLPSDYQEYVASLSYKARRNVRYYRRQSEGRGELYVTQIPFDQFKSAAWTLKPKCKIASGSSAVRRAMKMLSAADRPLLVGLRSRSGEWLSLAGGWQEEARATLFFQLNNDKEHSSASLSTVLRAYLVEMLIDQCVKELVLWGGSSAPLMRVADTVPALAVQLDKSTRSWRFLRAALSSVSKWMPTQIATGLRWVTPFQRVPEFPSSNLAGRNY
jgi:hypothetical protein